MVRAPRKNLGLGSQSWFIMEAVSLALFDIPPKSWGAGGGRPQDQEAKKEPDLIWTWRYDPLMKFFWPFIKMSKFPMKNSKTMSLFYVKNNTPVGNLGFHRSIQLFCWGILPACNIIPAVRNASLNPIKTWNSPKGRPDLWIQPHRHLQFASELSSHKGLRPLLS